MRIPPAKKMIMRCGSNNFPRHNLRSSSWSGTKREKSSATFGDADRRLVRTLYRNFLRWCDWADRTTRSAPITFDPVPPPVTVASTRSAASPEEAVATPRQTVLPVRDVEDVRRAVRTSFRSPAADQDAFRTRVSTAFEYLKDLNGSVGPALERRVKLRQSHVDRNGVSFRVGQVVKHRREKWRGIVFEWKRNAYDDNNIESTKLAQDTLDEEEDTVTYTIMVDSTDLARITNITGSDLSESDLIEHIPQRDLEHVSDPRLYRVRNPFVKTRFDRFDVARGVFVANPTVAYAYPADHDDDDDDDDNHRRAVIEDATVRRAVRELSRGVRRFAERLSTVLRSGTDHPDSDVLKSLRLSLASVVRDADDDPRTTGDVVRSLRALRDVTSRVSDSVTSRRNASRCRRLVRHALGSGVRDTTSGRRGVVVGYRFPPPRFDDGGGGDGNALSYLVALESWEEKDGGNGNLWPSPFVERERYMFEHQLIPTEASEGDADVADVIVDLDDEHWTHKDSFYRPSDQLKFQYGESLGDDEEKVSSIMHTLMKEIMSIHHSIRTNGEEPISSSDDIVNDLSMDNLFVVLRNSECVEDSLVSEHYIQEIWKSHSDVSVQAAFEDGLSNLLHGDSDDALRILEELVAVHPDYFEAWNKMATCRFLDGSMEDSMEATRRTLDLEPRHYPALAGMGLIQQTLGDNIKAAEFYTKCLQLSPWSLVSSRLSAYLDRKDVVLESNDETRVDGAVATVDSSVAAGGSQSIGEDEEASSDCPGSVEFRPKSN